MGLIRLLVEAPLAFLVLAALLLYSVIAHEVAHGWVARLFGDETAARYGRLTLDPRSHVDPVGALMLFVVGFGWARPVPVSYAHLRPARAGAFCVALAGCGTNILLAALAIAALQSRLVSSESAFAVALAIAARINIILGAFNLIPIPPLDGSKLLMSVLPANTQRSLAGLEPYGLLVLILLLFTGWLDPLITRMEHLIYHLIGVLLQVVP